jgi:hypothetical protein
MDKNIVIIMVLLGFVLGGLISPKYAFFGMLGAGIVGFLVSLIIDKEPIFIKELETEYYPSRLEAMNHKRSFDIVYYKEGKGYYIVRADPNKKSYWDRFT